MNEFLTDDEERQRIIRMLYLYFASPNYTCDSVSERVRLRKFSQEFDVDLSKFIDMRSYDEFIKETDPNA